MKRGWVRVGRYDKAERRSIWVKLFAHRIEIRAGREGDDAHVVINATNPAYEGLRDLFERQIWAQEC